VNGRRRSLVVLLLTTALLLTTVLVGSLVFAPQAPSRTLRQRLADAKQKLNSYYIQFDKAVEQYNMAQAQLQTVNEKITSNTKLLKITEYNLEVAKVSLTQMVVANYKQREVTFLDVLLSTKNFDQLVTQINTMQRFSAQDSNVVTSIKTTHQRLMNLRLSLAADKESAKRLVVQRGNTKSAVNALVNRQVNVASDLKSKIRAQQAAAQAAAAAAAAAAASSSTSSSAKQPQIVYDTTGPGHPEVVGIAQKYLGVPYVWGGASPSGFDCSGLAMYCYGQIGIGLPHGATMQQQMSHPVPLDSLQPGDLVFFGSASYSYHVGIYVGGGQMIEAPHTGAVVSYGSVSGAWIGGRF
jgi:peptidoglycan DL-endopeptidase CwlO